MVNRCTETNKEPSATHGEENWKRLVRLLRDPRCEGRYDLMADAAKMIEQMAGYLAQAAVSETRANVHPDNIEVMIDSILTVVWSDMREAAEKDLRVLVEMASATPSATRSTNPYPWCEKTGKPCEDTHLCHFPNCQETQSATRRNGWKRYGSYAEACGALGRDGVKINAVSFVYAQCADGVIAMPLSEQEIIRESTER